MLSLIRAGLAPFVETELRRSFADNWERAARAALPEHSSREELDTSAFITIIMANWNGVFRQRLSQADRGYLFELREVRNRWAHQRAFEARDVERAMDTAARLLRSVGATAQTSKLDELRGIVRPGVERRPPPPSAPPSRATRKPATRENLDAQAIRAWAGDAWPLLQAFISVRGPQCETFGNHGRLGICDGVQGVQWSTGIALKERRAWVAVNLEGMAYDDWPVARLIERELASPELPDLAARVPDAQRVIVHWRRDCWQAAGRVPILEADIAPTPMSLNGLSPADWHSALREAQQCLNPARGFRGRRRQMVTLSASEARVEREVSPHFVMRLEFAFHARDWTPVLREAFSLLDPLHSWATRRAAR